ncbi:MAG: 2-amino-4-hydroxy-6-hydroxymethyldihydropteridine diphosphokinase [Deltaproteobacteria bacterium]|nr:MAG: 2-amino-4-hydroxy-6-hydroxymethyldihydropteridine diphosphokinase [Deltaproteobacteria bacterium]
MPPPRGTAWVALGANLGDPRATLERARRWLGAMPGTRLQASSRIHVTAPVGPPQPPYLNAVVRLVTRASPRELLAALHRMEAAAGRVRTLRWGPRTLDLDLLCYEDRVSDDPVLTLPHPRLHERRFVLAPLCEIDPGLRHPRLARTMAELLAALP